MIAGSSFKPGRYREQRLSGIRASPDEDALQGFQLRAIHLREGRRILSDAAGNRSHRAIVVSMS